MYTFSNRLRLGSFIAMAVGLIFLGIGFVSAPSTVEEAKAMVASAHDDGHAAVEAHGEAGHGEEVAHDSAHDAHLLQQLQNRPWSALYVAALYIFMIALGVLLFYAINRAAQAGWAPLLFRVMEGISAYMVPGGIVVFVLLVLSVFQVNHLFVWMDPDVVAQDEILQAKSGYLNPTFFLIRALIYLGGWIFYQQY